MKIVFMGTPDFAVGILKHLLKGKHEVSTVVTVADKPAGRGKKLHQSAVKRFALAQGLEILQPTNLKDDGFIQKLKSINPDVIVVVAFRMLPKVVWELPKYGTINLHASLLPAYRGAAPINWAIINGEKTTGVTTFLIDDKIDTGAILLAKEVCIEPDETAGTLHDKLMETGKEFVAETLDGIEAQTLQATPQSAQQVSKAPKLTKDNTKIDWTQKGQIIDQFIRGLSPYPVAWTYIKENEKVEKPVTIKIYQATFKAEKHSEAIGTLKTTKNTMHVAVNDGWINIMELQYPGKRKMSVRDFLNGYTFEDNCYCF